MNMDNIGICNQCRGRVPAAFFERDGKTWIRKECPDCGQTESIVSTDHATWQGKRDLWKYVPTEPVACDMHCDRCRVDHKPNMVFLDVTNRCNMNCPICIATIQRMGFDFTPPMAYFEKIFAHLGKMDPVPMVELFGGEPTVRNDLVDIINIGRKHGMRPRVVTNGIRLADEKYCKMLCDAGVRLRFAFDGRGEQIYARLRNNPAAYGKKMKALENLKKFSRRKHAFISCAAYGINDDRIADMFQYIHDNRDLISDIGVIPLTENWEEGTFTAAVQTTLEDVEKMIRDAIPGGGVEFIPAGLSYCLRLPRSFFRENSRSEVLLLGGVHPNCESFTFLISDGKTYRGINHYLKKPLSEVAEEFVAAAKKMEPKLKALDRNKFFQRWRGRLLIIRTFLPPALRNVRLWKLNPIGALLNAMISPFKHKGEGMKRRRPRRMLRAAVLPFEEQHSIDAARLENCKAVFAYEDADDGQVKTIPACLWYPYRDPILRKLSAKYKIEAKAGDPEAIGPDGVPKSRDESAATA